MGVHHLWNILEPVRRKENLSALRNKTLCVDLSGWICEARCAKGLKQHVSKPHLRNLFFRLLYLTRLGVKLVFVADGEPPELKWEAIAKRIQARNGEQNWRSKNSQKSGSGARVRRSHFAVWVRECRDLLNLMGIPCIESTGEAEALCAWLDLHQIVDGCITNDGDAFLYGARTVYKDLCISGKDACAECYKMDDIESQLNLSRQNLVAFGILLGCDYLPQGVSGVGKEMAMKLIRNVEHDNLIDRFYEWTKETCQEKNLSSIEKSVKCKALKDKNFPHPKVIEEFLAPKVVPRRVSLKIMSPDLQGLEEFCLKNLEWPEEYTREKVLLLITYWQMTSSLQQHTSILVQPARIVKARIQQKIECYEVEWQNVALGETCPSSFVTIETRELFMQVYPDLVEEFSNVEAAKLSRKSRKKKSEKPSTSNGYQDEMDSLSQQLKDLSVQQSHEPCHAAITQNEEPAEDHIYKDESLQDIIDSILPATSDQKSCFLGRSSPFVGMNDSDRDFFAVGKNWNDVDSDEDATDDSSVVKNDDDYVDNEIPCDYQPLKIRVNVAAKMNLKEKLKSNDYYDDHEDDSLNCELFKLKAVQFNLSVQDVLDCSDDDNNNGDGDDDKRCSIPVDKPLSGISLETKKLAETKPIPCLEGLVVVVDSSDDDNVGYGEETPLMLKQSMKGSKAKQALLNDTDLNEIFGSSDLWSSDDEGEEKHKCGFGKSPSTRKPSSSITKSKVVAHAARPSYDVLDNSSDECLQKSVQDANRSFISFNNSLSPGFEENGDKNVIKEGFLPNVVQDISFVKLNTISYNDELEVHHGAGMKRSKEVPASTTKKVLLPRNISHNNSQKPSGQLNFSDSQKTLHYDSVNDVNSCKSSLEDSWKENVDSPLDDYVPAPLFKRLGQNFSAKQRLASLRSIFSTEDDI